MVNNFHCSNAPRLAPQTLWQETRQLQNEELKGLNDDEQKQRLADIKHWEAWLANVDGDLTREPARIREFYSVQSHRIEPVGLVYLMPASTH